MRVMSVPRRSAPARRPRRHARERCSRVRTLFSRTTFGHAEIGWFAHEPAPIHPERTGYCNRAEVSTHSKASVRARAARMRHWPAVLALVFALLVESACSQRAIAACRDFRPIQGPTGYRARLAPDRCEGLYQSLVSGEAIELLSFVRRPIVFDSASVATLTITMPSSSTLGSVPLQVVARALPLRVYYRLDLSMAPGQALSWPIHEVVVPAGLSQNDLGILAIAQLQTGIVFVPVDVGQSSANLENRSPTIVFRATTDLDSFQWRLYTAGVLPPWKQTRSNIVLRAGDPISISIDGPSNTVLNLEIAARPTGGDYLRMRRQVLLP